jgi:replicative DNA helicase
MAASVAIQLLANLAHSPKGMDDFMRLGLTPELFRGPEEEQGWHVLSQFVAHYGAIPSIEIFQQAGLILPPYKNEPVAFYADQLRDRHLHLMLKQGLLGAQEALNGDNAESALGIVTSMVIGLLKTGKKTQLVDFSTEGKAIVFAEMKKKKLAGDDYGMKFGWPTLDNMAEGMQGGDLMTIVGRPGKGKSYAMLYAASHGWMHQNKCPMIVSMEMKPLIMMQRLAALNASKPITQIKKAELSSAAEKDLALKMEGYKDKNRFWVLDGALAATVSDIILYARQLKPDAVWVDGAYLVKVLGHFRQRWERVTEVCEQLKADLAEALNIPVIVSFQFNRETPKKGKKSLDTIAYADAVGQVSSLILAMGMDDDEESPEKLGRRKVEVLKGRSGEIGEFLIRWLFDIGPNYMDFSEIIEPTGEIIYGMG